LSFQVQSIIVIDDQEETRTSIEAILSDEGFLVETAKNGKEAINASKNTQFDLAIVDIKLPDIDGTELLRRLRDNQPKMATLIVTGQPSLENAIKSVNNRADGYLLKPFEPRTLIETIRKILAEKSSAYFQMYAEVERVKQNQFGIR
jgi:DNA-binding response OmpR family regulator